MQFDYPEGSEEFEAAAFTQSGQLIKVGHREECEIAARDACGLYCLWINNKPVIRFDFEAKE